MELSDLQTIFTEYPKILTWYNSKDGKKVYWLDFESLEDSNLKLIGLPEISDNESFFIFHFEQKLFVKAQSASNLLELDDSPIALNQEQADELLFNALQILSNQSGIEKTNYDEVKDFYLVGGYAAKKLPNYVLYEGSGQREKDNVFVEGSRERSGHDITLLQKEVGDQTIDEEDAKYMDQRDAPRARPKKGKMVTLKHKKIAENPLTFPLFDLSMGGLAFLCNEEHLYKVNEEIEIIQFDEKCFEEPMVAIIRIVRALAEIPGQYKVGVQFTS